MHDLRCRVSFQVDIFATSILDLNLLIFNGANLQMQTHFEPQILHRNAAVILRQLYYSKISFEALVPGWRHRRRCSVRGHRSGHGVERDGDQVPSKLVANETDLQQLARRHSPRPLGQNSGEASRLQEVTRGIWNKVLWVNKTSIVPESVLS